MTPSDNRVMPMSPQDDLLPERDPASPARIFLDPRGRISRRQFWLYGVLATLALSLLVRALLDIARFQPERVDVIVSALLLWPLIAVSAKRWHDHGRSGWWALVWLIPVVGWLWILIDNGFVRGTPGPNRYGPAPTPVG